MLYALGHAGFNMYGLGFKSNQCSEVCVGFRGAIQGLEACRGIV